MIERDTPQVPLMQQLDRELILQQDGEHFDSAEDEFYNTDPYQVSFEHRPPLFFPGTHASAQA